MIDHDPPNPDTDPRHRTFIFHDTTAASPARHLPCARSTTARTDVHERPDRTPGLAAGGASHTFRVLRARLAEPDQRPPDLHLGHHLRRSADRRARQRARHLRGRRARVHRAHGALLDIGNWYVHKRQLQNRVDAAALGRQVAYGYSFPACTSRPSLADKHRRRRRSSSPAQARGSPLYSGEIRDGTL